MDTQSRSPSGSHPSPDGCSSTTCSRRSSPWGSIEYTPMAIKVRVPQSSLVPARVLTKTQALAQNARRSMSPHNPPACCRNYQARSRARRHDEYPSVDEERLPSGAKVAVARQRSVNSSSERHIPIWRPAILAAPRAVASSVELRNTLTREFVACSESKRSMAAAPPSHLSSRTSTPPSRNASVIARTWYASASTSARAN
jgi:hypothetical protein